MGITTTVLRVNRSAVHCNSVASLTKTEPKPSWITRDGWVEGISINHLNLFIMITMLLGMPVAMSSAQDWTTGKKVCAIVWMALIDVAIVAVSLS